MTGLRFQRIFATQCARIGTTFTLRRTTTSAYSAATSQATTSQTSYTAKGVFEQSDALSNTGQHATTFQSGTTDTRAQYRTLLVPSLDTSDVALPFTPATGDAITIGSRTYRVAMSETETADDTIVFHRVYLEIA